jgi:hypothetical protein
MSDLEITDYDTYEQILREYPKRTIDEYRKNPNIKPKQYLDSLSVGFYGLFSFQPGAWYEVLKSIRKYYPDAPIVLINDGIDVYDYEKMAKEFGCIYVKKDIRICLHWPDPEGAYEFLLRTKEACELAKTEWIIHLHPDVLCQDRISKYPNAHLAGVSCGSKNGKSCNMFNDYIQKYIHKYQPNIEINGWGWCGGSIMHVATFNKVYDSIFITKKFSIKKINDDLGQGLSLHTSSSGYTSNEDVLMSLLFNLNGFVYRIWLDNSEHHRGRDGLTDAGAFLHGIKDHYNLHNSNDLNYHSTKVIEENLEQSNNRKLLLREKLINKYNLLDLQE